MGMENEMGKLELCGSEVYALSNLLGAHLATTRDGSVLSALYERMLEHSAVGKVVSVSLKADYHFEGDFLAEYLEQLDDYEDTPSQREWYVLDRMFPSDLLGHLKDTAELVVTER